ncbi:hypothetical protein AAZX31_06G209700 [Glycine max]
MGSPIHYQFVAAFHNDRNIIQIPSFYHKQWAPNYPFYVHFVCSGTIYPIKVTKYHNRYFFTDGLKFFRKDYNIHESVTITFTACEGKSIFSVTNMRTTSYK